MSAPKDTQAERLALLELIAYWEGRVNTTLLNRQFGLSRQQVPENKEYFRKILRDFMGNYRFNPELFPVVKEAQV